MIQTTNRLTSLRQDLEAGKPVNFRLLADLQALDLAIAGRQFVEEAIKFQEAEDARVEKSITERP